MGHKEFSWTAIDREHERQGEADDAFNALLAETTKRHANAMRTNILQSHGQTLADIANDLGDRLYANVKSAGVPELLVHAAIACGPLTAGQMLIDLIQKCIHTAATSAALLELDRAELAGGLDMAAMRAAAPDLQVPA